MSIPSIGHHLRQDDLADEAADVGLSGGSAGLALGDIPHGWTNKWLHLDLLRRWQGFPGDQAWSLEHCWGCLGQPELLLYRRHNEGSTIFRAGGLYFILVEGDGLKVFNPNVIFPDILDALHHHRLDDILLNQALPFNLVGDIRDGQFRSLGAFEIEELERNRRMEQIE